MGGDVHELSLMQDLVDAVDSKLRELPGKKARKVVLEVGQVSGVFSDSLRFCFDICCQGSLAEGAVLEIVEIPGLVECRGCGRQLHLNKPYGCCSCGSLDLHWIRGTELKIRELEVA